MISTGILGKPVSLQRKIMPKVLLYHYYFVMHLNKTFTPNLATVSEIILVPVQ
jgi:hypothetical protein